MRLTNFLQIVQIHNEIRFLSRYSLMKKKKQEKRIDNTKFDTAAGPILSQHEEARHKGAPSGGDQCTIRHLSRQCN